MRPEIQENFFCIVIGSCAALLVVVLVTSFVSASMKVDKRLKPANTLIHIGMSTYYVTNYTLDGSSISFYDLYRQKEFKIIGKKAEIVSRDK